MKYELIVIGSGPAGEKAAVKAAYFGHKVALIEKEVQFGGAGVNTGTLPSKTLKETALFLSGKYDKGLYGINRAIQRDASLEDFMHRKNFVVSIESEEVKKNLELHHVDLYHGSAKFIDSRHIRISGAKEEVIEGENIIIATGSYPVNPPEIPFDHLRILDSDTILNIHRFPKSIAVLGAGVIGVEYSTIFATMGIQVFLINRNDKVLTFIDQEVVKYFLEIMKKDKIDILLNKKVLSIKAPDPTCSHSAEELIDIKLDSGEVLHVDMLLYAAGRNGSTKELDLHKVNIEVDKRECIPVNSKYQTVVPNIYAVGDCIGFPALASTSMDQGRVAVAHIFGTKDLENIAPVLPYGIYSVPEISTAGMTEEEAKTKQISYCKGIAKYKDMPRGMIMGAEEGFLKLLFTKDDLIIRGVHIVGPLATELVHHGLELIEEEKTLMDVIGKVYNFPTYHDLYKYAAYDGLGNLSGHKIKL